MNERDLIQTRGFKNVSRDGRTIGFQVRYRTPYYRGMWCSLVDKIEITVDGQKYAHEQISWTIGNRTMNHEEMAQAGEVHWPFLEPAILTVNKPGGLKPGLHDVEVSLWYRMSYTAAQAPPTGKITPSVFKKQMALVVA